MFKNYVVSALRNIRKNKLAALITVIGFSVGIACSLFVLLFAQYEFSFDRFLDGHDRVHRILLTAATREGREFTTAEVDWKIKDALLESDHGIEALTQVWPTDGNLGRADRFFYEQNNIFFSDASFLKVFPFPLAAGDRRTVLDRPLSLVLTRRAAEKYFGAGDPVGQVIGFRHALLGETAYYFTVTGVLENLPAQSSLRFDFVVNMPFERGLTDFIEHYNRAYRTNITARMRETLNLAMRTYVRLKNKHFLPLLQQGLARAMKALSRRDDLLALSFKNPRLVTEPFDGIYLFSPIASPHEKKGNFLFLLLLIGLGAVVIFIACINVVNLTTARALTRAKEIGIRRTLGASRRELAAQYLTEAVVLSFVSLGFALVLVEVFLPFYGGLVGRDLSLRALGFPASLAAGVAAALAIGVVSGLYPAFYLSAYNSVGQKRRAPSSRRSRELLAVVQFVFSIGLFISSAVILREFDARKSAGAGFAPEDLVMVRLNIPEAERKLPAMKKVLLAVPGVEGACASSLAAWEFGDLARDNRFQFMARTQYVDVMVVDPDFLKVQGIGLAAGRDFDPDYHLQFIRQVIVNETAARRYGFPVNATIADRSMMGKVIGVAKDFDYLFPSRAVKPLFLVCHEPFLVNTASAPRPIHLNYLILKIRPADRESALRGVERAWETLNPGCPFEYKFVEEEMARQLDAYQRSFELALGIATALAFLLSGLGLFGLATFEIERRTKEIGIRKTLGATSLQIVLHLLVSFFRLVGLANLIAWPLAFLLVRLVFALLRYPALTGVGPLVFLEAGAISAAVTALTVGFQTLRAASVNPVNTLRYE